MSLPTIGGVVLAGGRSSRMGEPKVWLDVLGDTFLARVVRIVSEIAAPVVVAAAADQHLPPLPSTVEIVRDDAPFEGPLAGILAGFEALSGRVDAAFVAACDSPLLRPAWIRLLQERLGDADIAMPIALGREQPLSALYRLSVLPTGKRMFAEGWRRPRDMCGFHKVRNITEEELRLVDPRLDSLLNANTPQEYRALLARARDAG